MPAKPNPKQLRVPAKAPPASAPVSVLDIPWLSVSPIFFSERLEKLQLDQNALSRLFHIDETTEKKSTKQKDRHTFNTVEKVSSVTKQLLNIKSFEEAAKDAPCLKPINFVVEFCAKVKPKFISMLIDNLLQQEATEKHTVLDRQWICFTALFRLQCISEASLPEVHNRILRIILDTNNLKLLFFYLAEYPSQVKKVVASGLLLWLILKAPTFLTSMTEFGDIARADCANIEYLFHLLPLLPYECSWLIHENIMSNLADFPWSAKHKQLLNLKWDVMQRLNTINNIFLGKMQALLTKAPYTSEDNQIFLIKLYEQTRTDRKPLNNYLLEIARLPNHLAPAALTHVLDTLMDISNAWPVFRPLKQHTGKKVFYISRNLLRVFTSNNAFLLGGIFVSPDSSILSSLLEIIVTLDFTKMMTLFQNLCSSSKTDMTRKQYEIFTLLLNMVKTAQESLSDGMPDSLAILATIASNLDSLKESLEQKLGTKDATLFSFESNDYDNIIQSEFQKISEMNLREFKSFYFVCLHQSNPVNFYAFLKKIEDKDQGVLLMQLTTRLCQDFQKKHGFDQFISEIESWCTKEMETIAWKTSMELVLNWEETAPILAARGISIQDQELFCKACLDRDFHSEQENPRGFLKSILNNDNAFVVSYFLEALDYYAANGLKERSTPEYDMIQACLIELRKKEKKLRTEIHSPQPPKRGELLTTKPLTRQVNKEVKQELTTASQVVKHVAQKRTTDETKTHPKESKSLVFEEMCLLRAVRKKALYSLFLNLFDQVNTLIKENQKTGAEVDADKLKYAQTHQSLCEKLLFLIAQQDDVFSKSEATASNISFPSFQFKQETLRLQSLIAEHAKAFLMSTLFHLHNQLMAALSNEIRALNPLYTSEQEKEIVQQVDKWLVISFSGMTQAQGKLLFWFQALVKDVESQALQEPSFSHCKAGFLKVGAYGGFIAKVLQRSLFDTLLTEEEQKQWDHGVFHAEDIDIVIFIKPEVIQGELLTVEHLRKLKQFINELLPPAALRRERGADGKDSDTFLWTWHGFQQHDLVCDLTFQVAIPSPVISHCATMWCLDDNQLRFLHNSEHTLQHIMSNRVNIIAKNSELCCPQVLAHIMRKILAYLQSGMNLTHHSKIILGDLLLSDELAIATILRFISFYGHRMPQLYNQQFAETPLPVFIFEKESPITLKEYVLRKCLIVYEDLDKASVLREFNSVNFMPLFVDHYTSPEALREALFQYVHEKIAQYEANMQMARRQFNFYSLQQISVVSDEKMMPVRFVVNGSS